VLDNGASCQFCRTLTATAEEGADEYAHLVLNESRYKSGKEGLDWVVSPCPECKADAFVDRGLHGCVEPADRWVCFSCGNAWPNGSFVRCDHCRELIQAGEGKTAICGDCLTAVIAKE
jgi:hypothetical protein